MGDGLWHCYTNTNNDSYTHHDMLFAILLVFVAPRKWSVSGFAPLWWLSVQPSAHVRKVPFGTMWRCAHCFFSVLYIMCRHMTYGVWARDSYIDRHCSYSVYIHVCIEACDQGHVDKTSHDCKYGGFIGINHRSNTKRDTVRVQKGQWVWLGIAEVKQELSLFKE